MKKLLLVLAVAAFVACNDSGNPEETPAADTPKVEVAPPPPTISDSTVVDSTKVDSSSLKK